MALIALTVEVSRDLRPFSRYLYSRGVRHYISELRGEQVVWVDDERNVVVVHDYYQRYCLGDLESVEPHHVHKARRRLSLPFVPVTFFLIIASMIGALLASLNIEWASMLAFYQLELVNGGYVLTQPEGQYWRLITPVFLHFGILHICFNSLWVWELGKRIEIAEGAVNLLGLSLVIGLASNLIQAWYAPGQLFGGMSGVIYGYLGYIGLLNKISPVRGYHLPQGFYLLMIGWLVACIFGVTELLGVGAVANAAHVGGLLAGLFLGLLQGFIRRLQAAH